MRRKPETNFTTHHVTDKEAPRLTWQGPSSTNSWKGTRVYHRTAMWANGWRPHKCPVTKVWLDQLGPKADKATFALHDMATFRHAEGRILSNIPTAKVYHSQGVDICWWKINFVLGNKQRGTSKYWILYVNFFPNVKGLVVFCLIKGEK